MDNKKLENLIKIKRKKRIIAFLIVAIVLVTVIAIFLNRPVIKTDEDPYIGTINYIENLNTEDRIEEFEKAAKSSISFDYNDIGKKKSYEECAKINSDTRYVLTAYERWFPVMVDNEGYYDRKDFNKRNDVIGTPYIYESDDYKIIFGHSVWGHQYDLMFTFLEKFAEKDFWKANRVLKLEGSEGVDSYLVTAVVNLDINSDPWSGWLSASPIKEDFTRWVKENALVIYDDNFNSDDDFLVLCTCDINQANARFLIVSKKV